jgi:hypothetical protein
VLPLWAHDRLDHRQSTAPIAERADIRQDRNKIARVHRCIKPDEPPEVEAPEPTPAPVPRPRRQSVHTKTDFGT